MKQEQAGEGSPESFVSLYERLLLEDAVSLYMPKEVYAPFRRSLSQAKLAVSRRLGEDKDGRVLSFEVQAAQDSDEDVLVTVGLRSRRKPTRRDKGTLNYVRYAGNSGASASDDNADMNLWGEDDE